MTNRYDLRPLRRVASSLRTLCAVALGIQALAACAPEIHSLETNTPSTALKARAPESVAIFSTSKPTRPFVEVAMITSAKTWMLQDTTDLVKALRQEAARKGCDGVILTDQLKTVTGSNVQGNVNVGESVGRVHGVCFVYANEKASAPPSSAPELAETSSVSSSN